MANPKEGRPELTPDELAGSYSAFQKGLERIRQAKERASQNPLQEPQATSNGAKIKKVK